VADAAPSYTRRLLGASPPPDWQPTRTTASSGPFDGCITEACVTPQWTGVFGPQPSSTGNTTSFQSTAVGGTAHEGVAPTVAVGVVVGGVLIDVVAGVEGGGVVTVGTTVVAGIIGCKLVGREVVAVAEDGRTGACAFPTTPAATDVAARVKMARRLSW
jgi:hypothetical protein